MIGSSSSPQQTVLLNAFQITCQESVSYLPVQVFRGQEYIILEGVIIWLQIQHAVWLLV